MMLDFDMVLKIIVGEIKKEYGDNGPTEDVRKKAKEELEQLKGIIRKDIYDNPEQLMEEVLTRCVRIIPKSPDILEGNPDNHIDWLKDQCSKIEWNYWKRYEHYLLNKKNPMLPSSVKTIDKCTNDILKRLENPSRNDSWHRKGLVIGYVQSGKTANYTGLVCKAADAGYKIIIVLTGMSEFLRIQTQIRLDEGFTGRSTDKQDDGRRNIGVSDQRLCYNGPKPLGVTTFTTSNKKGDYYFNKSDVYHDPSSGGPTLLVVKKNDKILKSVINNIKGIADSDNTDKLNINDVPLLIIDDEADNASISTKPNGDDEIKTINSLIRKIMFSFSRTAYVGYTATPYANVFIDPERYSEKVGEDLFPSDFIISLPEPNDYFGAKQFFGNPDEETDDNIIHPWVHIVPGSDYDQLIPAKKRKETSFIPTKNNIPDSLIEAIRFFILSVAVKTVRSNKGGVKGRHSSMIVHVTRFKDVQNKFAEIIEHDIIQNMNNEFTDGDTQLLSIFEDIWNQKFKPSMKEIQNICQDNLCTPVEWDDIKNILPSVIENIKVKQVNSYVKEGIDYKNHPEGLSVIAVGGNGIARGLTLEGLTVSYFLRDVGYFDTLLQMARWFGFRSGYIDICHVYIRQVILDKFRLVAAADENLRDQIRKMILANKKPIDYGLMIKETDIRSRTERMGSIRSEEIGKFTATAINKSKETKKITYNPNSGKLKQTTVLYGDTENVRDNLLITNEFIRCLGDCNKKPGDSDDRYPPDSGKKYRDYIWDDVPAKNIIDYLRKYKHHPENNYLCKDIPDYIETQFNNFNELKNWTVVLIQKHSETKLIDIAGLKSTLSDRTFEPDESDPSILRNKNKRGVVSKSDESLDLTYNQIKEAYALKILEEHRKNNILSDDEREEIIEGAKEEYNQKLQNAIVGKCYRKVRYPKNGLLLIYPIAGSGINPLFLFGVSLPESPTAVPEQYRANRVWLDNASDEDEFDE